MERADIAIIGTGPAGVSAAITAKVRGKTVLLFGSRELSSKLTKAHKIQNYPGLPDIDGAQLAQAFKKHLDVLEIPITEKQVTAVYAMGGYFGIQTPDAMLEASSVILAGGVVMGKPFPKEDELLGRGVSYCATCDAHFTPENRCSPGIQRRILPGSELFGRNCGQAAVFPCCAPRGCCERPCAGH